MAQVKSIQIIYKQVETQKLAGYARYNKEDDAEIDSIEKASDYLGPTFVDGVDCHNLNYTISDGFVQIHTGKVTYMYPVADIGRVKIEWPE